MSDFSRLATVAHELHGYYLSDVASQGHQASATIQLRPQVPNTQGEWLVCRGLTLWTPGDPDRVLVRSLDLAAPPRGGLLLTGASGVGKTTLLRAIVGLWHAGVGVVERVMDPAAVLFLPQRPYMQLGNLRDQLLYPHGEAVAAADPERYTPEVMKAVLDQVGLGHVATEARGGMGRSRRWTEELSLGEQQRIGVARILLHRPRYAILDEATSANDIAHEGNMYRCIAMTCEGYVSVGHRATIEAFHVQRLRLLGEEHGGDWQLEVLGVAGSLAGSVAVDANAENPSPVDQSWMQC